MYCVSFSEYDGMVKWNKELDMIELILHKLIIHNIMES